MSSNASPRFFSSLKLFQFRQKLWSLEAKVLSVFFTDIDAEERKVFSLLLSEPGFEISDV